MHRCMQSKQPLWCRWLAHGAAVAVLHGLVLQVWYIPFVSVPVSTDEAPWCKISCVPTYVSLFPSVKQGQWWYLVIIFTIVVKHLEIDRCYGRMILITRGSYCHNCKSGWKVSHWTILTKLHFSKESWTILWDCIISNTVLDRNVSK